MSRLPARLFAISLIMCLFVLGFSGSSVSPSQYPPDAGAAGVAASAGGATFLHLEPVVPPGSEMSPTAACRPVNRSGPRCGSEDPPGARAGGMAGVDRWRALVSRYFAADDVDRALDIIRCESNGDPRAANPVSTARGLFQHLASAWPERAAMAGRPGADIFDPEANIAVAAWLVYEGGGWSHWNASGHCW